MKSQFFPNRVFWRLDLATGLSREFKPWANSLAGLGLLSYSAIASVTLQLLACLTRVHLFGDLQAASHLRDPVVSPCFFAQSWAFNTLSHSLSLQQTHLNTGLLIAETQANLARNKANKIIDRIQPYINLQHHCQMGVCRRQRRSGSRQGQW